jgi:hypothetical protein
MTEDIRISVDKAGLDAFIVYADDLRHVVGDSQASQRQFDLMVAGLDRV